MSQMRRVGFFALNRLNIKKDINLIKRTLHYELLNEIKHKGFVSELKNDLFPREREEIYLDRSWKHFKHILKENIFYMYVDKAVLSLHLYPGHVASFLTNSESDVVEDSFVSLRNGGFIPDKQLRGVLNHDPTRAERSNGVWKVEFIKHPLEEFTQNLFKEARPIPKEKDKRRFLVGVPQSLIIADVNKFIGYIKRFKENYRDKEYILFDGRVNGLLVKSLNCVTGLYSGVGVAGSVPNPSPQMAAWTYLRFVLGEHARESLIENVDLRTPGKERTQDDELTPQVTSENIFRY